MSLESFCVDNTGAAFVVVDLVDIIARIRKDELKGDRGRKKKKSQDHGHVSIHPQICPCQNWVFLSLSLSLSIPWQQSQSRGSQSAQSIPWVMGNNLGFSGTWPRAPGTRQSFQTLSMTLQSRSGYGFAVLRSPEKKRRLGESCASSKKSWNWRIQKEWVRTCNLTCSSSDNDRLP